MKKMLKSLKNKAFPTPQEPRALDAIKAEMSQLLVSLGNEEYQVFVHENAAASLKQRVLNLNQEGAARIELDKAAQEAVDKKASNVQPA